MSRKVEVVGSGLFSLARNSRIRDYQSWQILNDLDLPLLLQVGRLCGKPLMGEYWCVRPACLRGFLAKVRSDLSFAGRAQCWRC